MNESMNQDAAFPIAYCLLCHKYTPILAELVHQLDTPGNESFIHVDGKTNLKSFAALPKGKRTHLIRPRVKIYWGDLGTVEAALRLFAATRDKGFRYVVLISGDTLPLRPANEIREILRSAYAEKLEFVAIDTALTDEAADRIRRRRFYPDKSTFLRRMKRFAMKRCMRPQNPFIDKLPSLKKGKSVDCDHGYPPLFARKFDNATDISRYRNIIIGQTTNDNNEKQ